MRYRRLDGVLVRVGADTPDGALVGGTCGRRDLRDEVVVSDAATESDEALVERLAGLGVERMRLLTDGGDAAARGC